MSRDPSVLWQIAVLLATALFAVIAATLTCPRHHECEAVDACAAQHGGAEHLGAVLIFDCAEGRVCCPPLVKKNAKMRRRHRKEEMMKRRQRTWALFDKGCGKRGSQRIYGETGDVKPGNFPWMALLSMPAPSHAAANGSRVFHCGGTLITERYVLTAAHCVLRNDNTVFKDLMVRLGETDTKMDPDCPYDEGNVASTTPLDPAYADMDPEYSDDLRSQCPVPPAMDFAVEEVVSHEKFQRIIRKSLINDIALLRLERSVSFSEYVTPICLPWRQYDHMKGMRDMDNFTIAGWGLHMGSNSQNTTSSPVLKKGEVLLLTFDTCKTNLKDDLLVTSKQTCTIPETANACMGDSGGPLTTFDSESNSEVQLGIVSFSKVGRCSNMRSDIVIYTKVFDYKNWIFDHLRPDEP